MKSTPMLPKLIVVALLLAVVIGGASAQDTGTGQPFLGNLNDPGLEGAAAHGLIQDIYSQEIDGVTVTLTHAFADANRIALWYTVEGLAIPAGSVKGRLVEPSLLRADGSWFGTGAMSGGVTPLDPQNAPGDYLVTFDHEEDYPADGFYHIIFRLQIGGTIWVLPAGYVPHPGRLPDQYRVDIPNVGPFDFALSLPASAPTLLQPNQTITANGITMTLPALRIAASQINLNLCYTLPDERDWQPAVQVSVDGAVGSSVGSGLMGKPMQSSNQRCIETKSLVFYEQASHHMTITVERLQTSTPEWTPDITNRAVERLRQERIEVEFYTGANGAGYNVIQAPDDLNNAQIGQAVSDALSEFYDGPWIFEVDLP